jgi:general secretion pathway protein K
MDRQRPANRKGIALVAVLWVLVLLSVIAAAFVTETRTEVNLARNAVDAAKARALADAGVHRAVLALLEARRGSREAAEEGGEDEVFAFEGAPDFGEEEALALAVADGAGLKVDGTVYAWRFGRGEVLISVQDEGGKIDLNRAGEELLKGLFVSVGVSEQEALALADAIADFRDEDDERHAFGAEDDDYLAAGLEWGAKDSAFELVSELTQVLGMTRALYERIRPALTVHSRQARVERAVAPPIVVAALGMGEMETAGEAAEAEAGDTVPLGWGRVRRGARSAFTVRAEAVTETGAVFVREAVVDLRPGAGQPFRTLAWGQGRRAALGAGTGGKEP